VDDESPKLLNTLSFPFAPVPKAKTLSTLTGALLLGLLAWSFKELWDWIKKAEKLATEDDTKAGE
jgi:hypothetical protein